MSFFEQQKLKIKIFSQMELIPKYFLSSMKPILAEVNYQLSFHFSRMLSFF